MSLSSIVSSSFFVCSSYLFDPICNVHKHFWEIQLAELLYPHATKGEVLLHQLASLAQTLAFAVLAPLATLLGIGAYLLGVAFQKEPFFHRKSTQLGLDFPHNGDTTFFFINTCGVAGGHPYIHGGVLPWTQESDIPNKTRFDKLLDKVEELKPDTFSACEVFTMQEALFFQKKLETLGYRHIFINIGHDLRPISSTLLFATKYEVSEPQFVPFPIDTLVGTTKLAAKGIFAIYLLRENKPAALFLLTHMQQSSVPQNPTAEEKEARRRQMEILIDFISEKKVPILLQGDLNADDPELLSSPLAKLFNEKPQFIDKTWGGDALSASLIGDPPSSPQNLDHALYHGPTPSVFYTEGVFFPFDPTRLNPSSVTDHNLALLTHLSM